MRRQEQAPEVRTTEGTDAAMGTTIALVVQSSGIEPTDVHLFLIDWLGKGREGRTFFSC